MESTKETLPKKKVAPAAHLGSSAGYSGISLSPPVQKKSDVQGKSPVQAEAQSTVIQRNGDEQLEAQQIQAAPAIPNRAAERTAAKETADSLLLKSTNAVLLVENLGALINSIPLNTPRTDRAIGAALDASSRIRMDIEQMASAGIEAAIQISNASDAEMDVVFSAMISAVIDAESALSESLSLIADHANPIAHIAVEAGAAGVAGEIMTVADEAKTESETNRIAALVNANGNARGRKRDKVSTGLDVGDTLNNFGGVAAGTAGLVEVFGVAGAGGGAAVAILGGTLGILFGSLGVVLGLYGFVTGKIQKKQLKKIAPAIQDGEMAETLEYAQKQTDTSISRSKLVIVAGGAAIAAGILGLVALSVLSLGAVAAVAGLAAALLGLSIVAFKYFHSRSKRKAERRGLAESLVADITSNGPRMADAAASILQLRLNPEDAQRSPADREKLIENLTNKVGDLIKSKRKDMAEGILDGLVNGTPSKQFQAELIIKALGRDPGKARSRIKSGDAATEVNRIMAKLSSW